MSVEKGGSKADLFVKTILIGFISLLAFSVGTFVGKQVSDSDHRRAALEGEYRGRNVASTDEHGEAQADAAGEKISDKELEGLTEEFESKEKLAADSEDPHAEGAAQEAKKTAEAEKPAAAAHGDEHGAKTTTAATPTANATEKTGEYKSYTRKGESTAAAATAKTESTSVAGKVASGHAPTDGKPEVRKPAAALPAVASSNVGKYTVQVASYATEDEAKSHAEGLKSKGWTAFYLSAEVDGRTWYRVVVGLFENSKNAQEYRAQFMKETNTKSAIVQKIIQ